MNHCIDLILGKAFCILIFFHFPYARLSVLKGFHFYICFLTRVKTENNGWHKTRKDRVYLYVEGRGSRVEGSMSRVEGNNFFNLFFWKMENKWKTNPSMSRVEGNNFIYIYIYIYILEKWKTNKKNSSHHIVKKVVKKNLKTDLTDILLSKWAWPPAEAGITK